MNKYLIFALALAALLAALPARATGMPAPLPVVTALSEAFEIVGRLDDAGFVFHVDRAPNNEPVLAATLAVEVDGREAKARFRPESGDYLIDDAAWLKPLRVPGAHALSFTLIAGEESDLLTGDLDVPVPASDRLATSGLAWPLGGGALLIAVVFLVWRLRHRQTGGAA